MVGRHTGIDQEETESSDLKKTRILRFWLIMKI